jgi:hypothetical protein
MSSPRRRNRIQRVDMQSAYRANPWSFSSLAVTRALLAPNSLVRAGGRAPMSRPRKGPVSTASSASVTDVDRTARMASGSRGWRAMAGFDASQCTCSNKEGSPTKPACIPCFGLL